VSSVSLWRNTPRKVAIAFLLAVFFVFTVIGFANDILAMGRVPPVRFVLVVILSGSFAVCYAVAGILLRRQFWKAFVPLFAVQYVLSGLLSNWFPDAPKPTPNPEMMERLHRRLTFDAMATTAAVCLGYAGFVYVSISEGKRYGEARAQMAVLESEMAAARHVQEVIVPSPRRAYSAYLVESIYKPAMQVGGDFFQILPIPAGGLLIVFGDVAGKGLPAAMLVSMLVGLIRATAEYTLEPQLMLLKLHERLVDRSDSGFCTALAAHFTEDGQVTIANAGQLSPYLDGQEVELAGALPLGISGGGLYEAMKLRLQPGSRLTFLSDGVVEAQNESGELFGFDRTKRISIESAGVIADAAALFGQSDDITVVTIERKKL
jgi:Stage II sporulation protein E (SpoIIE)